MQNIISGIFSATALRYLLAAIGGALVASGKVQPDQWETISGAILVVIPLILGIRSAGQSRVVTAEGKRVPVQELPAPAQATVRQAAEAVASTKPSLLDRLFGRR